MIINTGGRTDTVQYYPEWLARRFREGEVLVRNPFSPSSVTRYLLTPETVDCVVFCSKDHAPFLPYVGEIARRFPTYFFYTITAYGRDIEPRVPTIRDSVRTLLELERAVGASRIAWRYDPILVTSKYSPERHIETFDAIAGVLAGHIDRAVFSFVQMYKKLARNMPELEPVSDEDRRTIARGIGESAARHGIWLQSCADDADLSRWGIHRSGCVTLEILGTANGIRFKDLKHGGMRSGCGCIAWHDIGAYDSCPNGCRYCYATSDRARAIENWKAHDPASPMLIGTPRDGDVIHTATAKSMIKDKDRGSSIF